MQIKINFIRQKNPACIALLCCGLFFFVATGYAQPKSAKVADSSKALNAVLAQMDIAAKNFHSAQADFQWDQYERVVDNTDTQTGTISFVRSESSTEMAAQVKMLNGQPNAKDIVYKDGVLQLYQPSIDQMTVIHAGNNQARFESFLTLGFGGSGSDLKKNWQITDQGTEMIDGVKTDKLDLVGKQTSVRSMFDHITIWIDPARAISLKQKFFEPSGDSRTALYRNIRYNKKVPQGVFRIKTTGKTSIVNR